MNLVKINELKVNFKTVTDSLMSTNETVIVAGPKNKNLVLMSLETYNHLKSNKMENSNNINWKDDFRYNEGLHHAAQELTTTYSRLIGNYPEHRDVEKWKQEMNNSAVYNSAIKDMVFVTEEKAKAELDRVSAELKKVITLSDTLKINNAGKFHLA